MDLSYASAHADVRFEAGSADRRTPVQVKRAVYAAKGGDVDAVRYLYARYADAVYEYAVAVARDEYVAATATSSLFEKLPEILSGFVVDEVPLAAWLIGQVRVARTAAPPTPAQPWCARRHAATTRPS